MSLDQTASKAVRSGSIMIFRTLVRVRNTVGNFAFLFNCTPVGRTSDSMMVPT